MLALGLHTHAIIVAAIIDPLRHVATAGRVVCLEQDGEGRTQPSPYSGAPSCYCSRGREGGRLHLEDDGRRNKAPLRGGG